MTSEKKTMPTISLEQEDPERGHLALVKEIRDFGVASAVGGNNKLQRALDWTLRGGEGAGGDPLFLPTDDSATAAKVAANERINFADGRTQAFTFLHNALDPGLRLQVEENPIFPEIQMSYRSEMLWGLIEENLFKPKYHEQLTLDREKGILQRMQRATVTTANGARKAENILVYIARFKAQNELRNKIHNFVEGGEPGDKRDVVKWFLGGLQDKDLAGEVIKRCNNVLVDPNTVMESTKVAEAMMSSVRAIENTSNPEPPKKKQLLMEEEKATLTVMAHLVRRVWLKGGGSRAQEAKSRRGRGGGAPQVLHQTCGGEMPVYQQLQLLPRPNPLAPPARF